MATDHTAGIDAKLAEIDARLAILEPYAQALDASLRQLEAKNYALEAAVKALTTPAEPPPPPPPVVVDPPPAVTPPVTDDRFARHLHVGVNSGIGYNTDPSYVDAQIAAMKRLGVSRVRMGMDGVGGGTVSAGFSWAKRDAVIDKLTAAGIIIHTQVSWRTHIRDKSRDAWRRLNREWMGRYGDRIEIVACDNEPEINGCSAKECVEFTKIAWEERNRLGLQGKLLIESPPLGSIDDTAPRRLFTFAQLLDAGIADYCDVFGLHAYSIQYQDARFRKPFDELKRRGITKPIGLSEVGTAISWVKGNEAEHAAHYTRLIDAGLKWGAAYNLLFTLAGETSWTREFSILGRPQTEAAVKAAIAKTKEA